MNIVYYGDFCTESLKDEALDCQRWLKTYLFKKKPFHFKIAEYDSEWDSLNYDILIFDFGGIGAGMSGLVESLGRHLIQLIQERPNTLFICWTTFTNEYLKDACTEELGDYHNLICIEDNDKDCASKILKWIKENR